MEQSLSYLNNLTPSQFLREYWQKKPLLIKQAMPAFAGLLTPEELAGLACEEAVESRIVRHENQQWQLQHGPFDEATFADLPDENWTLLVQSVNHFLPEAAALLQQFDFIPHARLDDLMVSYASKGGSVGPHLDSYDVFLLQGAGKREWQISTQTQHDWIADAPIKVLRNFVAEERFVLEAGDMLYLPPQVAHWGTAIDDDCMTYSIGFRAPNTQQLAHDFLDFLAAKDYPTTPYRDPDLSPQAHPATISREMVMQVSQMLKAITWDDTQVGHFLAQSLSEPKPHVMFSPNEQVSYKAFKQGLLTTPLHLDLASQLLVWQRQFYLNGEALAVPATIQNAMQTLADKRTIQATRNDVDALADCLYDAYLAGYCMLTESDAA